MNSLGDLHFIRPAWLLLAPVVTWVWWQVRTAQDPLRGWRKVMDPKLLDALTVGRIAGTSGDNANLSGWRRMRSCSWRGWGLLAAWWLAMLSLAGPTWRPEPSPFADDPIPVMLVLKAGETMDFADLAPSRMERARLKVADFAAERTGQPLGLVAYAGSAHLVLPPTRDTSVVATMAAEISPAILPKRGDDLVGALVLASRTLGDVGGSVVVLADTVPGDVEPGLREFRRTVRLPIHFLAVAHANTPELDALNNAAAALEASASLITPDASDIAQLVRRTARSPVSVASVGEKIRWSETGWWLLPAIAVLSLTAFRRVQHPRRQGATV
jgi:Ca-activated chloride channel family protein